LLNQHQPWPTSYKATFAASALVVGAFYLWCAQAGNESFEWHYDNGGFYNLLGRALAAGHLYLPLQPSPELLALPDPWDPRRNAGLGTLDLVLYDRRYYLYHGPTPAFILFTPYRLLTGHDLPEAFAAFLFCWLGYLFSCGVLMRFQSSPTVRPSPRMFALLLFAIGICQSVPYLLQRVWVYEVAIAGGYLCISAGFWFLARGALPPRVEPTSLAFSGLMLGLAIGCRPHLAFVAICAGVMLVWRLRRERSFFATLRSRELLAFTLPVAACVLMLAAYNYERFRDPLEFGLRYQIAGADYRAAVPARENLAPGLFYLLLCPPDLDPVFPCVRHVMRPVPQLPQRYFLEPIAGAFILWPLAAAALAIPLLLKRFPNRPAGAFLATMSISAAGSLLFVAALGLVSHRFEVDFLPSFVVAACCLSGAVPSGQAVRSLLVVAILYSMAVNLGLGIQGPYDGFVQGHPAAYTKLAGWFSPVASFRPVFNPRLTMEALYEFPDPHAPGAQPLIAAGRFGSRYLLSAESLGSGRLRLTSAGAVTSGKTVSVEVVAVSGTPNRVRLDYRPESREVIVQWNGEPVLRHVLDFLVTAPAQFVAGKDRTGLDPEPLHFLGRVEVISRLINGETR